MTASTPNKGIPYVPEGALDPAAGLNDSLNVIDALLQTTVIAMDQTAPPVSNADGDLYIVADSATGDWAGHDGDLARYVAEGDFWQFFVAGEQSKIVFNQADGILYYFNNSSSPGVWTAITVGSGVPVVSESGALLNALANGSAKYTRFSHTTAEYYFDDAEPYTIGAEFHGRYVGSGSLTIASATGFTINPPAGGSLVIPPDGTFTVKIVAADEADLFGVTFPESP